MTAHFCTCTDLACPCHPSNHDKGCDPCVKRNLVQDEIPSCFFRKVDGDISGQTSFTMGSFVEFYLKHRGQDFRETPDQAEG